MRLIEWIEPVRRVPIVVVQLLLVAGSFTAAYWLRFDGDVPDVHWVGLLASLPWIVAIRGLLFVPFHLYQGLWRYTSLYDLQWLALAIISSSVVFAAFVVSPLGPEVFPRSVLIIDALLLSMLLGGLRMARRIYDELRAGGGSGNRRVLIYGAGSAGQMIAREMRRASSAGILPVGFIDDDPAKRGLRIHGVPVVGTGKTIAAAIDRVEPTEVLIAMPQLEAMAIRTIVRELEPFNLPIKTLPNLRDIIDGQVGVSSIRSLALEDLLARAPVGLDRTPLKALIRGCNVLVTGAGGSIGSELCRQISRLRPASLLMMDRYENTLHSVRLELQDAASGTTRPPITPIIGDITDVAVVESVFRTHRPTIVFHAAAHKHVPLMEENPCEAVKNNIRGTRLLVETAAAMGAERFIMISTDKAANPSSIMGASKRVAELIVHATAARSKLSCSIVRFGNVLGSNGSVVPRFLDQIRKGGPVTVTHPDVRRFFMVIPEAVQLVLHAAAQSGRGGTFVLDMGEQMKVVDVARNLIRLSGLVPDEDIRIEFTGLRPGEKLEEELVGHREKLMPSEVPKVFVVSAEVPGPEALLNRVDALVDAAVAGDAEQVRQGLNELVGAPLERVPVRERAVATSVLKASSIHAQQCPQCATVVHRSRSRGFYHHWRKRFTSARLFRCSSCGWRGWLVPHDFVVPSPASGETAAPPDLQALDR